MYLMYVMYVHDVCMLVFTCTYTHLLTFILQVVNSTILLDYLTVQINLVSVDLFNH